MSQPQPAAAMSLRDVVDFLSLTDELGIRIWLIGGWAVDAYLGAQSRPHADLDIVVEERDAPALVRALRLRGYTDVPRDDTRPENFALGDGAGREIDFHLVVLDDEGNGIYGPLHNGLMFPAEALTGSAMIGGHPVSCATPSWLVQSHTGYPVDADDWADVSALCRRFDLPIPVDYSAYVAGRPVAAVVTDLDGTLLDVHGRVPERVQTEISRLVAAGVPVIPATARPARSIRPILPKCTLAVCCNGALVTDLLNDTTLAERTFDPATVTGVIEAVRKDVPGLGFGLRCGDELVANKPYIRLRGGLPETGRPIVDPRDSDVNGVHGIALRATGLTSAELAGIVEPMLKGQGQISLSSASVLDLVPPGASKLAGLELVAELQGWPPHGAIGLGDMPNDLDMLRWVGWSAAPSTAHPDVLAAVDHVIPEPAGDGIAKVLEQLIANPR